MTTQREERRLVQDEGRVYWIYKDGSHRCVTDADCTEINKARSTTPAMSEDEAVEIMAKAMSKVTQSEGKWMGDYAKAGYRALMEATNGKRE